VDPSFHIWPRVTAPVSRPCAPATTSIIPNVPTAEGRMAAAIVQTVAGLRHANSRRGPVRRRSPVDRTAATPKTGNMPTSPPGPGRIRRSALAGVATTRSQRATKEVTWPNWTCKTGDLNAVRARSGFFLLPARPVSTATRAEVAFYETGRHLSLRQRGRNLRHDFRRASFAIPWHAPLSSIYT